MSDRLLAPDEPSALTETRSNGRSAFVITVDHASSRIARRLAGLGLPAGELERHIAWDIGALAVAERVASALDAPLVASNYSRLEIDCNRDPHVEIEIRQDLIFSAAGQDEWARRITRALQAAGGSFSGARPCATS
jgi:predicted N-formylglutamate amidohydrolase